MIYNVIGTPNDDDVSFLTDLKALSYLKSFPARPRLDLKCKFPGARDEALDLLDKILVFNPFFRPSVQECLDHPYLSNVRQLSSEHISGSEIFLDVDNEVFSQQGNDP